MMKNFLMTLIVPIGLMACPSPYANVNVCELMPPAAKEAEMIWDKTKDSMTAFNKLQQAGIVQVIMYAKFKKRIPKCKTFDTEPVLKQYKIYLLDAIQKYGIDPNYHLSENELERVNQAINQFPLSK